MLSRPRRNAAPFALISALLLAGCSSDPAKVATDDTSPKVSASNSPGGGASTCEYSADGSEPAKEVTPPPAQPTVTEDVPATIKLTQGDLGVTLSGSTTPCTVSSFVSLAEQGYFDDTHCHRLTTQGILVLQCGDPTATGTGGPGYTVPDELTGKETYSAGTLAMANTGQPNTGGSQFFIVYGKTPLPPQYAVFGTVDAAGIKVVQRIAKVGAKTDDPNGAPPKEKVTISSVTTG
jgi:peptidyl-prolyl cis-trans isomerase B (cyclophilin B)